MSLAEIEKQFQEHVLAAASTLEATGLQASVIQASGIEAAAVQTTHIQRKVLGTARVSVETRLGIYSDAYRARLEEALQTHYSELAKLLGPASFHDLARTYIARHRSRHFSIRTYGDRLSELLAHEEPYRHRPLLTELAAWEWAMTLAFDAADAPTLGREVLAAVTPEAWADLRFKSHPSIQRLSLDTNAPQVWKALSRNEAAPADEARERKAWLIWRRDLDTFFRSLEPAEAGALQATLSGEPFSSVCEALAEEVGVEKAATEAARHLARWLQDGLLVA